jgi:hypothetical protein
MALQAVRRVMQLPPLAFVSSVAQQLRAAVAEGSLVEDPDNTPEGPLDSPMSPDGELRFSIRSFARRCQTTLEAIAGKGGSAIWG